MQKTSTVLPLLLLTAVGCSDRTPHTPHTPHTTVVTSTPQPAVVTTASAQPAYRMAPDQFDVGKVADLLRSGRVSTAAELQDIINQDPSISYVDIDADGVEDYITISEKRLSPSHSKFVFYARPNPQVSKQIAYLTIEKTPAGVNFGGGYSPIVPGYASYDYHHHVSPGSAFMAGAFMGWMAKPSRDVYVVDRVPSSYRYSSYSPSVARKYKKTTVVRKTYTTVNNPSASKTPKGSIVSGSSKNTGTTLNSKASAIKGFDSKKKVVAPVANTDKKPSTSFRRGTPARAPPSRARPSTSFRRSTPSSSRSTFRSSTSFRRR